MVDDGFGKLQWRMRRLYVRVYEGLHVVAFCSKLGSCGDEGVEPSFYQFDLVAVMNSGCAEGG